MRCWRLLRRGTDVVWTTQSWRIRSKAAFTRTTPSGSRPTGPSSSAGQRHTRSRWGTTPPWCERTAAMDYMNRWTVARSPRSCSLWTMPLSPRIHVYGSSSSPGSPGQRRCSITDGPPSTRCQVAFPCRAGIGAEPKAGDTDTHRIVRAAVLELLRRQVEGQHVTPYEELQPYLRAQEQLLWAGRPDPKILLSPSDAFMIPFSLM